MASTANWLQISAHIKKVLLCKQLPAIRERDVLNLRGADRLIHCHYRLSSSREAFRVFLHPDTWWDHSIYVNSYIHESTHKHTFTETHRLFSSVQWTTWAINFLLHVSGKSLLKQLCYKRGRRPTWMDSDTEHDGYRLLLNRYRDSLPVRATRPVLGEAPVVVCICQPHC